MKSLSQTCQETLKMMDLLEARFDSQNQGDKTVTECSCGASGVIGYAPFATATGSLSFCDDCEAESNQRVNEILAKRNRSAVN